MRMEYLPQTYSVLSVAAAEKFHTSLRELLPGGATPPSNLRTTLRTHGAGFSKAGMILSSSARRCAMNSAPILHSTSQSNRARGYCSW